MPPKKSTLSRSSENPDQCQTRITRIEQFARRLQKGVKPSPTLPPTPKVKYLCRCHQDIDVEVAADILHLLQQELGVHFEDFVKHPEVISKHVSHTLARLYAMRGSWRKRLAENPFVSIARWRYRKQDCFACTLTRFANNQEALRNLRLLAESRVRACHKPDFPNLLVFLGECLRSFGLDKSRTAYDTNRLSRAIRLARIDCIRADCRDEFEMELELPNRDRNFR